MALKDTFLTQRLLLAKLPKYAANHDGSGAVKSYNHFILLQKALDKLR